MTTTDHNRETLRAIRADLARAGRPQACPEEHPLERAGDLALAGLWAESRFVAEQAREEQK